MIGRKWITALSCLLAGVMFALVGCGASSGRASGHAASANTVSQMNVPDSVRIQVDMPATAPMMTLTNASLVRALYTTINTLPPMPADLGCTMERGPHYTLTFLRGAVSLATVHAHRDGCRPVTISGEARTRRGISAFWKALDQAIYMATPPANPQRVSIEYTPQPGKAPESALITSATTAKRLYDAILALPLVTPDHSCQANLTPAYQLVFFAPAQAIPAAIHNSCGSVVLEGNYQSRGGEYAMSSEFRQIFQAILAGVTLSPARPDHLTTGVASYQSGSREVTVTDARLMSALYDAAFTLASSSPQPGCPSEADKVARKGTFVTFTFTQWSLSLLQITTYQGSSSCAQRSPGGPWVRAGSAFWDLAQRAAGT